MAHTDKENRNPEKLEPAMLGWSFWKELASLSSSGGKPSAAVQVPKKAARPLKDPLDSGQCTPHCKLVDPSIECREACDRAVRNGTRIDGGGYPQAPERGRRARLPRRGWVAPPPGAPPLTRLRRGLRPRRRAAHAAAPSGGRMRPSAFIFTRLRGLSHQCQHRREQH